MRVKELLKEKGMTAKELAKRLGMTETGLSISISENGNPSLNRLRSIAEILGVDVIDLISPESKNGVITCPKCGTTIKLHVEDGNAE